MTTPFQRKFHTNSMTTQSLGQKHWHTMCTCCLSVYEVNAPIVLWNLPCQYFSFHIQTILTWLLTTSSPSLSNPYFLYKNIPHPEDIIHFPSWHYPIPAYLQIFLNYSDTTLGTHTQKLSHIHLNFVVPTCMQVSIFIMGWPSSNTGLSLPSSKKKH